MKFLKLFCGLLVLVGCSNRVILPYETPSNEKVIHQIDFYAWGLVGEGSLDIFSDCPKGRAYQVHSYTSTLQALWTVISLGIYVPKTVEITCSGIVSKSHEMQEQQIKLQEKVPQWDRNDFFTPSPKATKQRSQPSDQR